VLLLVGRVDEAQRDALQAFEASQRTGNIEDQAFASSTLCQIALAAGQPAEALTWAERVLEILRVHDHERVLHEVLGWKALALARLGRGAEAEAVLDTLPEAPALWPHVQVRTDLSVGRALTAVGRPDAARDALHRALAVSEANGFRTFQLATHSALSEIADETTRDRHTRIAAGIARSLAANLPTDDAERFLAFHAVAGALTWRRGPQTQSAGPEDPALARCCKRGVTAPRARPVSELGRDLAEDAVEAAAEGGQGADDGDGDEGGDEAVLDRGGALLVADELDHDDLQRWLVSRAPRPPGRSSLAPSSCPGASGRARDLEKNSSHDRGQRGDPPKRRAPGPKTRRSRLLQEGRRRPSCPTGLRAAR
jgi:tetratricopeptide (TPR) repeat protein